MAEYLALLLTYLDTSAEERRGPAITCFRALHLTTKSFGGERCHEFRAFLAATSLCVLSLATAASSQQSSIEDEIKAGAQAYEHSHYPEAENHYLEAIARAEKSGNDDSTLSVALNDLAALRTRQGKYSEAEPLYLRAQSIRNKISGSESAEAATIMSNLGALYADEGRYSDAEPLYEGALEIRAKLHDPEDASWASILCNTGSLYFSKANIPRPSHSS